MKQINVDLCNFPEVDEYCHLAKDKTAATVSQFLYELICRHGCFSVQINDQGRQCVNHVSTELHRLTGIENRVTSVYHPQSC